MKELINIKLNKENYISGDTIQGDFLISVPASTNFDISGIYLQFQGFERVRFRQRASETEATIESDLPGRTGSFYENGATITTVNTGIPTVLPISQPHFMQTVLICLTIPVTRHSRKLSPGLHSFPFAFSLPGKLLPSLNFTSGTKYSASIEYNIQFQVFQRKKKPNEDLNFMIPVKIIEKPKHQSKNLSVLPFLEKRISISHGFCACFNCKEFDFFANWHRNTFHPGEAVDFSLKLSLAAGSGSCRLKLLSVKLIRELVLSVEAGQSFRTVDPITKSKFSIEGALISDTVGFELAESTSLNIPNSLEPTLKTNSIEIRYFFVFEIDFRWYDSVLLASEVILS